VESTSAPAEFKRFDQNQFTTYLTETANRLLNSPLASALLKTPIDLSRYYKSILSSVFTEAVGLQIIGYSADFNDKTIHTDKNN